MLIDIIKNMLVLGTVVVQLSIVVLVLAWILSMHHKPTKRLLHTVLLYALPVSAIGATFAFLGSMFYSNIVGWTPCMLCWYQRIAIFPLSILLWVATYRHDRKVIWYALPLSVIGMGISGFHYLLQITPIDIACDLSGASCAAVYSFSFGYITIALMAFTITSFISLLLVMQHVFFTK